MSEYVPFGDEWKSEVMRLKKSEIVDMLAKALREQASRPAQAAPDGAGCAHKNWTEVADQYYCYDCDSVITAPPVS